jgi:hypothetical protein
MLAAGKIPMFRFGSRMRIYVKGFKVFLDSRKVGLER